MPIRAGRCAWRDGRCRRGGKSSPSKPAPRTSLNHPVGAERRLAIVRGRLDLTKQIAHAHHAKVNDVVLAAVAGGLRELLAGRGEDVGLVQRAMVTITQHQEQPGQAQGNKPGWMMVPLPLGEPDPVRRLELIAAETAARKDKARPEAGSGIFRFVAGQRVWYRLFPRQRSVNLVVSNVPGPPVPLYLAGAPLLEVFPMMPTMGNLTLVVAALSYAGQLNLAAAADRDNCPDVDVFAQGVRRRSRRLRPVSTLHRHPEQDVKGQGGVGDEVHQGPGEQLLLRGEGRGPADPADPSAGATASTWGTLVGDLAGVGRIIAYDRRGYSRSGGEVVRSASEHALDAAAVLEAWRRRPAVVVGTSAGATIALDLAVRRPDLVRAVVVHEAAWRALRHPDASGLGALARMQWLAWRGRYPEAAETLLRWVYGYRGGGSAWDEFPEAWRRTARENGRSVVADLRTSLGGYPRPQDLAKIAPPVVCTYGSRSRSYMRSITRSLAQAIPRASVREIDGAAHAVPFDAPGAFAPGHRRSDGFSGGRSRGGMPSGRRRTGAGAGRPRTLARAVRAGDAPRSRIRGVP